MPAVIALAACAEQSQPDERQFSSPSVSSPSSETTGDDLRVEGFEDLTAAEAQAVVEQYYRVTDELFTDVQSDIGRAATVATGTELDQLRRSVQEQRLDGWRQVGSVSVATLEVTAASSTPTPSFEAEVCVDVSAVDVVDPSGTSVITDDRPPRSQVTLTVVDQDERWLVEQKQAQGVPCG